MPNPAIYDTATLLEVARRVKPRAPRFFLPLFTRQINFDTQDVMFDKVFEDERRLAPFVAPNVQGRPQRIHGYETLRFRPAYIKQKDIVSAEMHLERMAGEALGTGSLSIEQRRNAVIAYLLRQQTLKIENRWEWMAAKAVIDAQVTVEGEDYPAVTVDFRRHADLSATLSGANAWNQSTAKPLQDLREMRNEVKERSGVVVRNHVFGLEAWESFTQRVDLKDLMDKNYGGMNNSMTRAWDGFGDSLEYMGRISGLYGGGGFDAWVFTGRVVNEDGQEEFLLDQDTVIGVPSADALQGVRCFGAIHDARAGYRPLETFRKNWINEDPSVEYLLSQSAPLMVPKNPDTTFKIKVQ